MFQVGGIRLVVMCSFVSIFVIGLAGHTFVYWGQQYCGSTSNTHLYSGMATTNSAAKKDTGNINTKIER